MRGLVRGEIPVYILLNFLVIYFQNKVKTPSYQLLIWGVYCALLIFAVFYFQRKKDSQEGKPVTTPFFLEVLIFFLLGMAMASVFVYMGKINHPMILLLILVACLFLSDRYFKKKHQEARTGKENR